MIQWIHCKHLQYSPVICAYIVSYKQAILVYIFDLQNTYVLKNTTFSILTQKACELQIDMFFLLLLLNDDLLIS